MPNHTFTSSGRHQSSLYDSHIPLPLPKADAWSPKPYRHKPRSISDTPSKQSNHKRQVVAGLPRATTFKRQQDEQRQNLLEPSQSDQRRDRRRGRSVSSRTGTLSKQTTTDQSIASESCQARTDPRPSTRDPTSELDPDEPPPDDDFSEKDDDDLTDDASSQHSSEPEQEEKERESALSSSQSHREGNSLSDEALHAELESRWILNLSMAFRDKSNREKFFITFAETPTRWRRVTVSIDYANAVEDSLEESLKRLHWPRDKSAQIYEAIRNSLPTVQFYETVTNLKLETEDGRLHVHVTEDMNEIIRYPSLSVIGHLPFDATEYIRESEIEFDSHLSGFVYKVSVEGRPLIKKEIPGPDMVEEFLYEVNALHKLKNAPDVIKLRGIVVDDHYRKVKGLLIEYAPGGSLVDLISDARDYPDATLSWAQKQKWARQIVSGLAAIHEAGFVQGDFTLSNIVIDENDDAKIIDINRRGCPMGWEPPEFLGLIESGQRLFMYIGVKSDMYQLGMVLWALASTHDEPERQERPLEVNVDKTGAPAFLRDWVDICVKDDPQERWSAKELMEKPTDLSPPIDHHTQADLENDNHAAIEVVGMDRQADTTDYPSVIPDTEFPELSKPSIEQSRPHAQSFTGQDMYEDEPDEIAGLEEQRAYYQSSNGRRSTGHDHGRIASLLSGQRLHQDSGLGMEEQELVHRMRHALIDEECAQPPATAHGRFDHPAHQDSGFGEDGFTHAHSAMRNRFACPPHQDSGFAEDMLDLGPVPLEPTSPAGATGGRAGAGAQARAIAAAAAGRNGRRNPDLLAGIGAHASGSD